MTYLSKIQRRNSQLRSTNPVLADVLFNARIRAGEGSSVHDRFIQKDIWDLARLFSEDVAAVIYRHVFWALLQSGGWHKTLLGQ